MKINVKKPAMLEKLAESAFSMKLKASMAMLEDASEEGPVEFLLRAEHAFSEGEESTLFIIGLNNEWKKYVKSKGWLKSPEAKKTAVGICTLKDRTVDLVIQKGKMPSAAFNKAIKASSVLKKYVWNVTESLATDEAEDLVVDDAAETPDTVTAEIEALQQEFQQLTRKYKAVNEALKAATERAEKEKRMLQRNKIFKLLKIQCQEWEELLPEMDAEDKGTAAYQATLKLYQTWSELLAKLKEAKAGESDDEDAIEMKEEQFLAKALSDVNNFSTSLQGVMDVDVVEESVEKLAKHIAQWNQMTQNGQNAKLADEFEEVMEKYEQIKAGWTILKPLLSEWHGYKAEIEALQEKGEAVPEGLAISFLATNQRIQTAI